MVKVDQEVAIYIPYDTSRMNYSYLINSVEYVETTFDCRVTRRATKGVGIATLHIRNKDGELNDIIKTDDEVKIYAYPGNTANMVFVGSVTRIKYVFDSIPYVEIEASEYSWDAKNRLVNRQYTTLTDIGAIFSDLISTYLGSMGHTVNSVDVATGYTATPSWQNRSLLDCLQDLVLLTDGNYDFYCADYSTYMKDWHFFRKGSVVNNRAAVFYRSNCKKIDVDDVDAKSIFDKVTVIGNSVEGMPLMYTVGTGNSEYAENNNNLQTLAEVQDRAEKLYAVKSRSEQNMVVTARGMQYLKPGDAVFVYAPQHKADGWYVVSEYTHVITEKRAFNTTNIRLLELSKSREDLISFLKQRVNVEQQMSSLDNPNNMKFSWIATFGTLDSYVESYANTEVLDSNIVLMSGAGSGTVTLVNYSTPDIVASAHISATGDNLTNMTWEVSNNGGMTWTTVALNEVATFSTADRVLKARATLTDSQTKIKAIGVLYTTI